MDEDQHSRFRIQNIGEESGSFESMYDSIESFCLAVAITQSECRRSEAGQHPD
jgi:hypothetical protein